MKQVLADITHWRMLSWNKTSNQKTPKPFYRHICYIHTQTTQNKWLFFPVLSDPKDCTFLTDLKNGSQADIKLVKIWKHDWFNLKEASFCSFWDGSNNLALSFNENFCFSFALLHHFLICMTGFTNEIAGYKILKLDSF